MALTWQQQIQQGGLKVKGGRASEHQAQMGYLICAITKKRGGDLTSAAGAIATSIQEAELTNMKGGDRDSAGLFQQRPSVGSWGTYAQVTEPVHAINAFLDQYLAYRRKGMDWLTASAETQRPAAAYRTAPGQWWNEGLAFARWFSGAGASALPVSGVSQSWTMGWSGGASGEAGGGSETRVLPYEYSRGSADKRENSWDCSGRLAQEVNWFRFMRRGKLWFASPNWLAAQSPRYAKISDFAPGVVKLSFEWETRTPPAEANLTLLAERYALAPGDVVELVDSGPGNGRWLVASTRHDLQGRLAEATLKRGDVALPEPAPQTQTITKSSSSSGGMEMTGSALGGKLGSGDIGLGGNPAHAVYAAADAMSARRLPYVWGGGHSPSFSANMGSGYDCSGSVSWVLAKAGIPLPAGGGFGRGAPVSGAFTNWGEPGRGQSMTIHCSADHIWIQWHGIGTAWRFDTSEWGCGYEGPQQRGCPRSTSGFVERHWRGT